MFKEYIKKIIDMNSPRSIDPSQFNDPIALQTEWTPARGGGANFRTRHLKKISLYQLEFQPTWMSYFFCTIFILLGSFISLMIIKSILFSHNNGVPLAPLVASLFPLIISSSFILIGVFILRHATSPIIFDTRSGFFRKGHQTINKHSRRMNSSTRNEALSNRINTETLNENHHQISTDDELNSDPISESRQKLSPQAQSFKMRDLLIPESISAPIHNIYAIQTLSERVKGRKGSSFISNELNLVLKDGSRINVIDHGDRKSLKEDAQKLAEFLNVPLWDTL